MRTLGVLVLAAASSWAQGGGGFPGVSLRFEDETVPPGAIVQVKLSLTEPKPIIRSSFESSFESSFFDDIYGVAVGANSGDASGAVMITPTGMRVAMTSPGRNLGANADYPIFSFAAGVKSTVPVGTKITIGMPSGNWLDLLGAYPSEFKDGTLTVGGTLSIGNIIPGGGTIAPNQAVEIVGTGFRPDSSLRVEANGDTLEYVSPTLMRVRFSTPTVLDGLRFVVTNKDNQRVTYYSYLRAARANWTAVPALIPVRPMFSGRTLTRATFSLLGARNDTTGISIQNPGTAASTVTVDFYGTAGAKTGSSQLVLASRTETLRSLAELGAPAHPAFAVITATQPVKAIAVRVNGTALSVIPPSIGQ